MGHFFINLSILKGNYQENYLYNMNIGINYGQVIYVLEKLKDCLLKNENRKELYLATIVFGLGLIFSIIDFQFIKNERIIYYFPFFNLIAYNNNSISIFACYFWILSITVLVIIIIFLFNKQKREKLKNDLVCLVVLWSILLASYLVTMSCTLWAITDITSLSSFNSEIITNVSTFLEYKSLVAYKYVRTFKDGSFKEGTAISLNFTICFVGSVLSLILSLISKQLESKKNSHNK